MTKLNKFRVESDSLGEIKVPSERYYGAQTQRSLQNFSIGEEKMPLELVYAITLIKKAAAITHHTLKLLSKEKHLAMTQACDEIINHQWDFEFPLSVWQSGSGTQTHMNVNEVIANRSNELLQAKKGSNHLIHPNDDVNKSQSTNDVISSAIQIMALTIINTNLLPSVHHLANTLHKKQTLFSNLITVGRTHMGDAVPMYLGQRFSAYVDQLKSCLIQIKNTCNPLNNIPIGGTAIGTGVNAPKGYTQLMIKNLQHETGLPITSCDNFFSHLATLDVIVDVSGSLNTLSCVLIKIANDIRLMSSGPRCGLREITLPVNEPGSSIMPGKTNPTQCEALIMVATRVQGNHVTITNANSLINFEAHSFRPVIIYSLMQSIHLLSEAMVSFSDHCIAGIEANDEVLRHYVEQSLALATILNTHLGYEKASKIAKKAYHDNITLKKAALDLGLLNKEDADNLLDPKKML